MNSFSGTLCLLLLSVACGRPAKPAGTKESTAVADGNIATRVTVRDQNVLIDYTDTKKGDTVLLFVHGWAINKNYFSNQISYFQDRYRVVTVDLPGYGQSGKNRSSWTIQDFSRDLDSVMTALNLNKVILVGHSMSGDIVLDAAIRDTQRVIGIVGIDNFKSVGLPENPRDAAAFQELIKGLKQNFAPAVSRFFNEFLFSKDTDSSIRKQVLTDVAGTDSTIAIATMETQNYNEATALKTWQKPLYLINSDYFPTDSSGLNRAGLPFYLASISRSGHFPMVEQPQSFDRALQQIIFLIGAEKPATR